jgi:hypothetical protein
MSRIRTTACRAALAIAAIFGGGSAWGGEVTVVGSLWQPRPVFVPDDAPPLPPPVPPSPDAAVEGGPAGAALDFDDWFANRPFWDWNIDYRCRALASSSTSSEFGTPNPPPSGYAPLCRRNFPISSLWHGVRAGIDQPTWGAQFEWMMPQQGIGGQFSDYDWRSANPTYTDLGFADQRWIDGQMIDFGMEFQWTDRIFDLPIEIWPTAGFRWQRFNIKCRDRVQYKYDDVWFNPPDLYPGDVLRFNQQYYMGYLGGQVRTRLRTVLLTFQADWGCTWGNNVAHDLLVDGDQYTMDFTQGNSWHVGFTAEVPLSLQVSLGCQFDHMQIRTTGTHHLLNLPLGEDSSWKNGVSVSSHQTSVMAFLRLRM